MIKHNNRAARELFATLIFSLFIFAYIFARSPIFFAKGEVVSEPVVYTVERRERIQIPEVKDMVKLSAVDDSLAASSKKPAAKYLDIPLDVGLQDHIFTVCEKYGVNPGIVVAMIERESGFNVDAIGDSGNSLGLMQIQPRWNYERMERLGCYDLLDPYQNITVGVDILAEYLNDGGSLEWALMAYNGGPSYANNKIAAGVVSDYAASVIVRSGVWA